MKTEYGIEVENYFAFEGFELYCIQDSIQLGKGKRLIHGWVVEEFSYPEAIMAAYAEISQPPLIYN